MIKLSVCIITFNEEEKIAKCLDSVVDLADEIIVLDSFSTDKTKEIAEAYSKVSFHQQKFLGHIEQKNDAIKLAKYDYILSLDADEALSDQLKKSITEVKAKFTHDSYFFNRLTYYGKKPIRHSGWYPDRKLRIFKKSLAHWGGVNPHDIIVLDEKASSGYLSGDLLHYSYDDVFDHVKQTNYFTTIAAKQAYAAGVRSNFFKILSRTILKFFKDYFLKLGILDGYEGFVVCYINALSACLKFYKILELQRKDQNKDQNKVD